MAKYIFLVAMLLLANISLAAETVEISKQDTTIITDLFKVTLDTLKKEYENVISSLDKIPDGPSRYLSSVSMRDWEKRRKVRLLLEKNVVALIKHSVNNSVPFERKNFVLVIEIAEKEKIDIDLLFKTSFSNYFYSSRNYELIDAHYQAINIADYHLCDENNSLDENIDNYVRSEYEKEEKLFINAIFQSKQT
jgi:hypothetical protein